MNDKLGAVEQREILEALRTGRLNLLYVTPERFADPSFRAAARDGGVGLLAVDEAHCISEWGHDFRPSYLLISEGARAIGRPTMLALTATATPWVREEIIQRLALEDPLVVAQGFDRPNLFYEVYVASSADEKRMILARLIAEGEARYPGAIQSALAEASRGSGIIYTSLTRTARELSQLMNRHGVLAAYYHGQLKPHQRNAVQDRFRDGGVRAIAATNAFGLGVDLPYLRFVAHFDAPASLEAYYQESGRAGRDGAFARCPLIFLEEDLGRASFIGGTGAVTLDHVEQLVRALGAAPGGVAGRPAIERATGLTGSRVVRGLELLRTHGVVSDRRGRYRLVDPDPKKLRLAAESDERYRQHNRTRLDLVRSYALSADCRRQFLLRYFGQHDAVGQCGMCDRCVPREGEPERVAIADVAPVGPVGAPFSPGDRVAHRMWGAGEVTHVSEGELTVRFAESGYRTLDARTVVERGLLEKDGE